MVVVVSIFIRGSVEHVRVIISSELNVTDFIKIMLNIFLALGNP